MAPGWDAWEQVDSDKCDTFFIFPVDFFYHSLISFIYFFPLKPIPRQGSVVPPSAPQDYCGSNDTSRSSITGTIEWFKPFLVLAWASGELNMAYSADPIPAGMIASLAPFRKGRVQCSQDRFLLKRWLCLSDSFSLFLIHFFIRPSCRFSFQLYPEACFYWLSESHRSCQGYIPLQKNKIFFFFLN